MICRGGALAPPHRVCFFGTYARDYTVTRLLRQACTAAGIEMVECHRPLWEQTRHKNAAYFGARSAVGLLAQYGRQALVLARMRRAIGRVALYLVGFNGQLDSLLLRLLLLRQSTPIVAAPLVTLLETLVDDRGVFGARSLQAQLIRRLDQASLSVAAHVIIDTEAHRQYLIETLGLAPSRVSAWHLGADPEVFHPMPSSKRNGPLRVLFCGTFLPLHGVMTVLQAAALLANDEHIEFELIGDGPDHRAAVAFARDAGISRLHFTPWMPYERLGQAVASADVCLGIFGTTRKAPMVIPNKVYQAAMVGRPVITADSPAIREVFAHGETAMLCPAGDATAVADAIRLLANDGALRHELGQRAAAMMADRFSPAAQGEKLARTFVSAMSRV